MVMASSLETSSGPEQAEECQGHRQPAIWGWSFINTHTHTFFARHLSQALETCLRFRGRPVLSVWTNLTLPDMTDQRAWGEDEGV